MIASWLGRGSAIGWSEHFSQQRIFARGSCSGGWTNDGLDEDALLSDFDTKYVGAFCAFCARAAIPYLKEQLWGRIINISGGNARIAGNLSGGARNVSLVHLTKTLAVQMGKFGITVNCIHPGITRTERTVMSLMEARAKKLGVTPQEAEALDYADGSPRGNYINRMVDASEIGFLAALYLASDKSWAITGEVIMAGGGSGNVALLLRGTLILNRLIDQSCWEHPLSWTRC